MNRYALTIALAATLLAPGVYAQRGRGAGGMGQSQPPVPMPRGEAAGHSGGVARADAAHPATVGAQVDRNPVLSQRLQPLLPQGMTMEAAAAGFKNQGQFVAALHVSKNLGIPFAALKDRMTGTPGESLGSAIRSLRPEMSASDVRQATRAAEQQAKGDLRSQQRKSSPGPKDAAEPKDSAEPQKN